VTHISLFDQVFQNGGSGRTKRRDLLVGGLLWCGAASVLKGQSSPHEEEGYRPMFDGITLRGWNHRTPPQAHPSPGRWAVEDGAIVGGQVPRGVGSYLVSEEAFDDFEVVIDARPDWPADTGILIRAIPEGNVGIQVLLEHRPHGGIAGYYGKGLGGFHAFEYAFNAEKGKDGRVTRLIPEGPSELTARVPLDFAAPVGVFLKAWKPGEWNRFRIRSVGALPYLTTWINGEKISELDISKIKLASFDPKATLDRIGRAGHIALEVHDNDARMGKDRWAPGAVCRWRNIYVRNL
jgi:hypothetical protein